MTENDVATMMFGSIRQILLDDRYLKRRWTIEDSRLTDEGERAIIECINIFGPRLIQAIDNDDYDRSKEMMLKNLKGDRVETKS